MPYNAYSIFAQLLFISGPLQFKQKFSANLVEDLISEADGEAKILAVRKTMTSGMPSTPGFGWWILEMREGPGAVSCNWVSYQ